MQLIVALGISKKIIIYRVVESGTIIRNFVYRKYNTSDKKC